MYDVDLFVIGAGSGGVRAARIAASYGAKVIIAEEYRVGGTCVIRGCVPKKLMVIAGQFKSAFDDAKGFGWEVGRSCFRWEKLRSGLMAETRRLEGIYRANLEKAGVSIVDERAVIEDAHTIRLLASQKVVTAKTILVATGATPSMMPDIPGIEYGISSNEVFSLEKIPSNLVVLGGGYIAVEFASIFANLGSSVTLVHRGNKVLRGFDEDVRTYMGECLKTQGVNLQLETTAKHIHKAGNQVKLTLSSGKTIETEQLLVATGRKPNTTGVGLEKAGVQLGRKHEILVDDFSRTNIPSIYAVGDVTDRVNLTPVAIREGHAFADNVFGEKAIRVNHNIIPTAVFTSPEIGVVGLTEAEAREQYPQIKIFKTRFRPMSATFSSQTEYVFMKIIVDAQSDCVLGVHIIGEAAAEIIQAVGIAVTMGATKADFDRTIALHPSAAEELVTMRTPVPE